MPSPELRHGLGPSVDRRSASATDASSNRQAVSTPESQQTSNSSYRESEAAVEQNIHEEESNDSFYWHSGRSSSDGEDGESHETTTATPDLSRKTTHSVISHEAPILPTRSTSLSPNPPVSYGASALGFGGPSDWEYFGDYEAEEIDDEDLYTHKPRAELPADYGQHDAIELRKEPELVGSEQVVLEKSSFRPQRPLSQPTGLVTEDGCVLESKWSPATTTPTTPHANSSRPLTVTSEPMPSDDQRPDLDEIIRAWSDAPHVGRSSGANSLHKLGQRSLDNPGNPAEASLASTPGENVLGVHGVPKDAPPIPRLPDAFEPQMKQDATNVRRSSVEPCQVFDGHASSIDGRGYTPDDLRKALESHIEAAEQALNGPTHQDQATDGTDHVDRSASEPTNRSHRASTSGPDLFKGLGIASTQDSEKEIHDLSRQSQDILFSGGTPVEEIEQTSNRVGVSNIVEDLPRKYEMGMENAPVGKESRDDTVMVDVSAEHVNPRSEPAGNCGHSTKSDDSIKNTKFAYLKPSGSPGTTDESRSKRPSIAVDIPHVKGDKSGSASSDFARKRQMFESAVEKTSSPSSFLRKPLREAKPVPESVATGNSGHGTHDLATPATHKPLANPVHEPRGTVNDAGVEITGQLRPLSEAMRGEMSAGGSMCQKNTDPEATKRDEVLLQRLESPALHSQDIQRTSNIQIDTQIYDSKSGSMATSRPVDASIEDVSHPYAASEDAAVSLSNEIHPLGSTLDEKTDVRQKVHEAMPAVVTVMDEITHQDLPPSAFVESRQSPLQINAQEDEGLTKLSEPTIRLSASLFTPQPSGERAQCGTEKAVERDQGRLNGDVSYSGQNYAATMKAPATAETAHDPYADLDPWGRASLNRFAAMLREEARVESNKDKLNIFNVFASRESRLRVILYGTDDDLLMSETKPPRKPADKIKGEPQRLASQKLPHLARASSSKKIPQRSEPTRLQSSVKELPPLPPNRESVIDLASDKSEPLRVSCLSEAATPPYQRPTLVSPQYNSGGHPIVERLFRSSDEVEQPMEGPKKKPSQESVKVEEAHDKQRSDPLDDLELPAVETSGFARPKTVGEGGSEVKDYLTNRRSVYRPFATQTMESLENALSFGGENDPGICQRAVSPLAVPRSQYNASLSVEDGVKEVTNALPSKTARLNLDQPSDLRRFVDADFDPLLMVLPSSEAILKDSGRLVDMKNVMESVPDDFGFIHAGVLAWDAKVKCQRELNDKQRHARQMESEQRIDALFDDHEIGYGDIAELEGEFKRSEAAKRAEEDRFEYQVFVEDVFNMVWTRLHYQLDQLIPHYEQYSNLMKDALAGREIFDASQDGLALAPTMTAFLGLHQKIEIRHQKAFEAVLERDRRLKKTEISPWYTLSNISKVKQLEKQFEDAEKRAIIEYCQQRDKRANRLMDVLDQNTLRGVGSNQDYMEAVMKAVRRIASGRAFASVPSNDGPKHGIELVQKAKSVTSLLATSSEQIVQTFHVADMLLNSADYEVSVAKAKVAKADMATLAKLKEERAKEDQKLMRDLEHRLALIREDTRRTNDEIVKLMLFLGVQNGRAVNAQSALPAHGAQQQVTAGAKETEHKARIEKALEEAKTTDLVNGNG